MAELTAENFVSQMQPGTVCPGLSPFEAIAKLVVADFELWRHSLFDDTPCPGFGLLNAPVPILACLVFDQNHNPDREKDDAKDLMLIGSPPLFRGRFRGFALQKRIKFVFHFVTLADCSRILLTSRNCSRE